MLLFPNTQSYKPGIFTLNEIDVCELPIIAVGTYILLPPPKSQNSTWISRVKKQSLAQSEQ